MYQAKLAEQAERYDGKTDREKDPRDPFLPPVPGYSGVRAGGRGGEERPALLGLCCGVAAAAATAAAGAETQDSGHNNTAGSPRPAGRQGLSLSLSPLPWSSVPAATPASSPPV